MFELLNIQAGGADWGHMGSWGWGMALLGFLFMLLVVGLIVWLVVYLARGDQGRGGRADDPLEILDERYARGELDREEYLERRSDLGGSR